MIVLVRLCAAVLAIGLAPAAAADSIDGLCPDNPDRIERPICADPELKAARDRMEATLTAGKAALSERGDAQLAAGQEAWRTRMHRLCGEIYDPSLSELGSEGRSCVQFEYYARNEMLAVAIRKVGPFQFSSVERFEGQAATGSDVGILCRRMICRDVRYPQIDAPLSPAAERWNEDMADWAAQTYARQFEEPDAVPDDRDFSVEAIVHFADADFISAERGVVGFVKGEPAAVILIQRYNRWLESGGVLEAADLFNPATDWAGALKQAAATQLAERHPTMNWHEAIERQAADPSYWLISDTKLSIQLEYGANRLSGSVDIAWRDLTPYLVSPLPLALKLD